MHDLFVVANFLVLFATCCICLLCRDSDTGVYKLTVSQEQEVVLRAEVYNAGEEAHQAILSVVLPPDLHYVGTAARVSSLHFICSFVKDIKCLKRLMM